jgi:hypothetical protein
LAGSIKDTDQIHEMESFRRALVFGTGFSLLLISIVSAINMWKYSTDKPLDIYDIPLLIFSAWGIYYVVFLWFSFLLMGFKELKGCAWAMIPKVFFKKPIHVCIDSVLNGYQDKVQKDNGISLELLKTDGSRVWGLGVIGLLVFAYVLIIESIESITLFVKLIFIGSFSSLYYLYYKAIHNFSRDPYLKEGKCLDGDGDFQDVLKALLCGLRKGSSSKK